ncbi:MAG: HdeD family acid-resistance protein [Actinomycetales bacterium]
MTDVRSSAPSDLIGGIGEIAERSWKWMLGIGIASIVLGILLLVWPGVSVVVAAAFFGAYLLISGAVQLVMGVAAPLQIGARILTLISGALSIVLGVVCFRSGLQSIALLGLWIGIGWIISGIGRLASGGMPGYPSRGWAIFDGVLLLIGGVILLWTPITSLLTLTLVSGWMLIILGVVEIVHAFQLRRATRHA